MHLVPTLGNNSRQLTNAQACQLVMYCVKVLDSEEPNAVIKEHPFLVVTKNKITESDKDKSEAARIFILSPVLSQLLFFPLPRGLFRA
jgi:hypothetical protein